MNDTVSQMTITQLREMLEGVVGEIIEQKLTEIFADPGEGLEIRDDVLDRLVQQKQAVASGERGRTFEDVAQQLGFGIHEPYRIRVLEKAADELKNTEESVGRRILRRINWLASNLDYIQPKSLKEDIKGLYKLRAGDYRTIYEIISDERAVAIHAVAHIEEIHDG